MSLLRSILATWKAMDDDPPLLCDCDRHDVADDTVRHAPAGAAPRSVAG